MRGLSLRQPWLWSILWGGVRIYHPVDLQDCDYRGRIVLRASKTSTQKDHNRAADYMRDRGVTCPGWTRPLHRVPGAQDQLPYGALVGLANIDGELRDKQDFAAYAAEVPWARHQNQWWRGSYALVLTDVWIFNEPIPHPGAQRFFDVPDVLFARMGRVRAIPPTGTEDRKAETA